METKVTPRSRLKSLRLPGFDKNALFETSFPVSGMLDRRWTECWNESAYSRPQWSACKPLNQAIIIVSARSIRFTRLHIIYLANYAATLLACDAKYTCLGPVINRFPVSFIWHLWQKKKIPTWY